MLCTCAPGAQELVAGLWHPDTLLREKVTCPACCALLDLIEERGLKVTTTKAWCVTTPKGAEWLYRHNPRKYGVRGRQRAAKGTVTIIYRFSVRSLKLRLQEVMA